MDFETRCIHRKPRFEEPTGSVVAPLYLTSSYRHPGLDASTGYDYSRLQNPTREQVEDIVNSLEGGHDALAFSSGMAAVSCVMELFAPGNHLITSWDLYGGSIRLFDSVSTKNGLTFSALDTSDIEAVISALTPQTRALFVESPTNPTMVVSDIARLAEVAHNHGALLIVDNTFLTPYFQRPLELGADLVVHSGSKYLGGHNDVLAGFLVSASPELSEQLRFLIKTTGTGLSPFDSWLVARGLKTLPLRMERHQQSAFTLAHWLCEQPCVNRVFYPGLASDPSYEVSSKQSSGFGGMIAFTVDSTQAARKILEQVQLIAFAESLGGAESLITYPLTQTHADLSEEERAAKGIDGRFLRISVGLESVDDLIADLDQAFKAACTC